MTQAEAAQLVGKDIRTIKRWAAVGINVSDKKALLEYSERMDARSRGKTRNRIAHRLDASASNHVVTARPLTEVGLDTLTALLRFRDSLEAGLANAQAAGNETDIFLAQADLSRCERILSDLTALLDGCLA